MIDDDILNTLDYIDSINCNYCVFSKVSPESNLFCASANRKRYTYCASYIPTQYHHQVKLRLMSLLTIGNII